MQSSRTCTSCRFGDQQKVDDFGLRRIDSKGFKISWKHASLVAPGERIKKQFKITCMTTQKLICTICDGTMILSLNRPEKLNAIDNDLSHELLEALHAAGEDETVRVVLLKGNGRAFCAGRDLSAAPTEEDLTSVQAVAKAIISLSKPVMAAVHG